jgi:uncharacterized membrane protein
MADLLSFTRWIHYISGVMWIGLLWFFNFVNANYQTEVPADLKKTVNPPLLLRALFFFRWGAMFTLLTGLIMLGVLWGAAGRWWMNGVVPVQACYMGFGVLAGIMMWRNVWFVIWPAQKKIITGMQGGPAADPSLAPKATKASKLNTYLSVPLLLGMMGGAHGEYMLFGGTYWGLVIGLALGMGLVYWGYSMAPKVSSKIWQAPQ